MRRLWLAAVVVAAHFALSVAAVFGSLFLGGRALFGEPSPLLEPVVGGFLVVLRFPLASIPFERLPGPHGPDNPFVYVLLLANSMLCGIAGLSLWRWWRKRRATTTL